MNPRFPGVIALIAATIAGVGIVMWNSATRHGEETAAGNHGESTAVGVGSENRGNAGRSKRPEGPADHGKLLDRLIADIACKPGEDTGDDGESRFHQLVDGFKSADFAALVAELASRQRNGSIPGGHDLQLKLLVTWAALNPPAAAASLAGISDGDQADAHRVVAGAWARSSPDEALAWAKGLSDGDLRAEALIGIGHEEVFKNPQKAIELAEEAGMTPGCMDLVDQAVTTWAAGDARAALTWGQQIQDAALREKVVAGVAVAWADRDPYGAAKLVIDSVGEGGIEENALVGIVQRIAFRDMDSAREWVAQFPEGRLHERAESELTRISERSVRAADVR